MQGQLVQSLVILLYILAMAGSVCLYWHTVCVRWLTLSWLRGLFRGIGRRERGERERGEREREREESERRQGGGEGDIKYRE